MEEHASASEQVFRKRALAAFVQNEIEQGFTFVKEAYEYRIIGYVFEDDTHYRLAQRAMINARKFLPQAECSEEELRAMARRLQELERLVIDLGKCEAG